MPEFEIRTFQPVTFDSRRLQARLLNVLKDYLRKIEFDLDSVTMTWEHQPQWQHILHYAGGDFYVRMETDDAIFGYLDEGTSIRWALMSRDFMPKTQVKTLASFGGSGHAVLRGQSAMEKHGVAARPGIEARKWTELIEQIRGTNFELDIEEIIREELGLT